MFGLYVPLLIDFVVLLIAVAAAVAGVRLLWIAGSYLKRRMHSLP